MEAAERKVEANTCIATVIMKIRKTLLEAQW